MVKKKAKSKDKKEARAKKLENIKYWSLILLICAIVLFVLSVVTALPFTSTGFLLLGIVLFIIWLIVYFSLDEKIRRIRK